ncbi:MAG: hypothetical protein BWY74_04444 [Firmicutes bacterium ADurb.Bin419]|nr:MAG: hypothetical protein BWY74_04444 [Firmicutes bacterium ADurb.Bin419]
MTSVCRFIGNILISRHLLPHFFSGLTSKSLKKSVLPIASSLSLFSGIRIFLTLSAILEIVLNLNISLTFMFMPHFATSAVIFIAFMESPPISRNLPVVLTLSIPRTCCHTSASFLSVSLAGAQKSLSSFIRLSGSGKAFLFTFPFIVRGRLSICRK